MLSSSADRIPFRALGSLECPPVIERAPDLLFQLRDDRAVPRSPSRGNPSLKGRNPMRTMKRFAMVPLVALSLLGGVRSTAEEHWGTAHLSPQGHCEDNGSGSTRSARMRRKCSRTAAASSASTPSGPRISGADSLSSTGPSPVKNSVGVGNGVSPKTPPSVGMGKVDVEAIPAALPAQLKEGKVDLDDPATTIALLQLDAVVGVKGVFDGSGKLTSLGLQCAFCHSTVDDSLAAGIGHRRDGWANRDLNVGMIVSLAPNLSPFTELLGVDEATVKKVLLELGPRPLRCGARQGRQGVPARWRTGGHAHPAGVRSRRSEPAHLDGLRLGPRLERVRRRHRDARQGHLLRRSVQRPDPVSRRSQERRGEYARRTRSDHREARPASLLPACDSGTAAARGQLRPGSGNPRREALRRQSEVRWLPRSSALHRTGQQPARAE